MHFKLTRLFCALCLAGLTACGGGDEDESTKPVQDTVQAASSLNFVNGQVTDQSGLALNSANIEVVVNNAQGQELLRSATQTDERGYYHLPLPSQQLAGAHQVYIIVDKDSFINAEKRITLQQEQQSISSDIQLTAVGMSVSVTRQQLNEIASSASGEPTLKLSLMRSSTGKERIAIGDVVAAADEERQISVSIPTSGLAQSVETINGELAYFDSSNNDDVQNFPGEFRGYGEAELQGQGVNYNRTADQSDEYRLISSTFSQIRLTDQNDTPLPLSDIQSASGEATSFTFKVPLGSYQTLERDFDVTVDGIQMPIYVYRSGTGWQYVGNGLLVDGADVAISEDIILPDGSLDLSNISNSLYVKVDITEANNWIQWVNLDWPVYFNGQVFNMCLKGNVTYDDGSPFNGNFNLRLPDGGYESGYISNGKVDFSTALLLNDNTNSGLIDKNSVEITVFNRLTDRNEVINLNQDLLDGQCTSLSHTMLHPFQCHVEGTVYAADGRTPLSNKLVRISSFSQQAYQYTDINGQYRARVACGSTEVSSVGDLEVRITSKGNPSTVDLVAKNQSPILAVYRAKRQPIVIDETATVSWYASDPDSDDQVTIATRCVQDGCTITSLDDKSAQVSFAAPGNYTFVVTAEDSKGAQTERNIPVEVIALGNKAPKVTGFNFNGRFVDHGSNVSLREGESFALNALATDRNGDQLTYVWQGINCSAANCSYTLGSDNLSITTLVSDGELTTEAGLTIEAVADAAPSATLALNKDTVGETANVNAEPFDIELLITDDFTAKEDLEVVWSLVDNQGTDFTDELQLQANSQNLILRIEQGRLAVGVYTLEAVVRDKKADGTLNQSTPASRQLIVTDDLAPTITVTASTTELYATDNGANQDLTLSAKVHDDHTSPEDLTLAWSVSPDLNFVQQGSNISISAQALLPGSYTVTATVTDSNQQATSVNHTIVVAQDNPPNIDSFNLTPSAQTANDAGLNQHAITANVLYSDDYAQEFDVTWSVSPEVSFSADKNTFTIAENSIAIGSYQVTVKVKDNSGLEAVQTASFSITEDSGNVVIVIE